MTKSGARSRPPRILIAAKGPERDRIQSVLRAEGYILEVADDLSALLRGFANGPAPDVLVLNGMDGAERAQALAVAGEHSTWCVHLRVHKGAAELPPLHREQFVFAIPLDADDGRILNTIRTVIAARRAKTAG